MHNVSLFARLGSISFAAVLTLAMLAGVDTLAGSEPTPQQLARAALSTHL